MACSSDPPAYPYLPCCGSAPLRPGFRRLSRPPEPDRPWAAVEQFSRLFLQHIMERLPVQYWVRQHLLQLPVLLFRDPDSGTSARAPRLSPFPETSFSGANRFGADRRHRSALLRSAQADGDPLPGSAGFLQGRYFSSIQSDSSHKTCTSGGRVSDALRISLLFFGHLTTVPRRIKHESVGSTLAARPRNRVGEVMG